MKYGLFFPLCSCFARSDKTIKLWKIVERHRRPTNFNLVTDEGMPRSQDAALGGLRVPRYTPSESTVEALCRRVYANAHAYHINSVSLNSDTQTFLSADDLRVNLWQIDDNSESYSILHLSENVYSWELSFRGGRG